MQFEARFLSDRAERLANAILRAALAELTRIEARGLLQETIAQQSLLPPAPPGSPAYTEGGQKIPYLARILDSGCKVGVVMHDPLHCVTGDHLINHVVARHKPFSYVLSAMTQYILLGERVP